jgi:hypothetical protein
VTGARRPSSGIGIRDRRSQLTIAAVAFLLGLLVVVQLQTQAGGSALQNKSAQDLTTLVGSLNTRNDQLRSEIGTLQNQLDELRADKANGATSVEQIQAELARIRAWAGVDAVAGRGVTIVVSGQIAAAAVDDLLNELRNAGAEAIAVEDVRVVPGRRSAASRAPRRRWAPAPRSVHGPGRGPARRARRIADAGRRDHRPARRHEPVRDDRPPADRRPDDAARVAPGSRPGSWSSASLIPSAG